MSSVESYGHLMAKNLLTKWLRDAAEKAGNDNYTTFGQFTWRVNRPGPYWGIWEEYPVVDINDHQVWDEKGFETPPTFNELKRAGTIPVFILDVAIQHKGEIIHGFEIVNKNPPSKKKICDLHDWGKPVHIVKSSWVMSQVGVPKKIVAESPGHERKAQAKYVARLMFRLMRLKMPWDVIKSRTLAEGEARGFSRDETCDIAHWVVAQCTGQRSS